MDQCVTFAHNRWGIALWTLFDIHLPGTSEEQLCKSDVTIKENILCWDTTAARFDFLYLELLFVFFTSNIFCETYPRQGN